MALINISSPHSTNSHRTATVMRQVIYATIPALLTLTWAYGIGNLLNVLWCVTLALALEAGCLKLRHKAIAFHLGDYSAAVTGVLLGLAIPPFAPWWLGLIGMLFAIPVAKHLYGGLGHNPFNPAMIAYALLLVSFPLEMTRWPSFLIPPPPQLSWLMFTDHAPFIDKLTGATPLDSFRVAAVNGVNDNTFYSSWLNLEGWGAVNLAFAVGGLYLLYKKVIGWHIPVSMLTALTLLASVFFLVDDTRYASPLIHLLSGATMMGAFFIATDPVSAATSKPGRLLYGAGIGILVYIIRTWGGYPDAVAFAVLLMNLVAPTIDHILQPRTFGHPTQTVKWIGKKP